MALLPAPPAAQAPAQPRPASPAPQNAAKIPFKDRSYDLVTAWEVLHHIDDPSEYRWRNFRSCAS